MESQLSTTSVMSLSLPPKIKKVFQVKFPAQGSTGQVSFLACGAQSGDFSAPTEGYCTRSASVATVTPLRDCIQNKKNRIQSPSWMTENTAGQLLVAKKKKPFASPQKLGCISGVVTETTGTKKKNGALFLVAARQLGGNASGRAASSQT